MTVGSIEAFQPNVSAEDGGRYISPWDRHLPCMKYPRHDCGALILGSCLFVSNGRCIRYSRGGFFLDFQGRNIFLYKDYQPPILGSCLFVSNGRCIRYSRGGFFLDFQGRNIFLYKDYQHSQSKFLDVDLSVRGGTYSFSNSLR